MPFIKRLKPPVFVIPPIRHTVFIDKYDDIPTSCPKCGFDDPTVIKDKNHAAAPVGLYCCRCDTHFKRKPSGMA